ncbi:MAG: restriction endonuclease subunit S [Chloroflexi bacterium]|nr:restriction endonuclease subunit S [Chloroflexota bacterium]MCI0645977.1 restriction endonuclease subunit S [Chloroflexota bacterium]MCI0727291.1 restriction endonuclease subunit S [Chloroflexota bacterium]
MIVEFVTLGSLCEFTYGDGLPEGDRHGGTFPVYGSNGIVGWHDKGITQAPVIVIGRKGSIGEVHYSDEPSWPIDTTYYVDRTKVPCDLKWLYYILLALDLTKLNKAAAVPGLNRNDAYEKLVPLPQLADQKRIAGILARADRLRQLRRYALQLSDTYLQSIFLQMFGDPMTNPMGWEESTLGDLIISAKDGPHVSPSYTESGIPFLSTRNVRPGEIIWDDLKYISLKDAQVQWKKVKPEMGDILYTKGGTTGLAKAIDFDIEIAVWVHIAVLKLKRNLVDPIWLESMLNSEYCYRQSQELTKGIVNRDLGLKRMPKIKMYHPPLYLQQKFAQAVKQFTRLEAQQREAARQADHLFDTLLHRAFSGEL